MRTLPIILSFLSLGFLFITAQGQDLSKHRWKNRVLLVLTSDTLAPEYRQQMESILSDPEGLEERKLKIYKVIPSGYQEVNGNRKWIPSRDLHKKYHQPGNTFEVVLIGLDGSVKQQKQNLVPVKQIFSWIDSMPMRMEELRRKDAGGT